MDNKINLGGLLPDFSSLTFFPQTTEQLSALVVLFLFFIFLAFLIFAIRGLYISLRRIGWLSRLLKNQNPASIASNRQELKDQAQKVKHKGGHLWEEFDETLIEVESNGQVVLQNTLDSHHFFNSVTLANKITESRMLAAVPGFLTAVGVIGTFVGLQLGLAKLNIGNDVAVTEMKDGLAGVISGAKIAFMTSVWGVSLSVLFNFVEKLLESFARKKIYVLQVRIDSLFHRLSAESQLQNIVSDGKQSRKSLQGLAEKIGEKMQEAMFDVTNGIQKSLEASLEKVMAPAINKLVDETSDGNQKALGALVEKFLDKVGEQGSRQREAMDMASKNVSDALTSLDRSMSEFLINLGRSQRSSEERESELMSTMSSQISGLVNHFEKSTSGQIESTQMLVSQGENLQNRINESISASSEVGAQLKSSASELKDATKEIREFSSYMKSASDSFSGAITDVVRCTSDLAQQNNKASKLVEQQRQQLIDDREYFSLSIDSLQSLVNSADTSFDKMRGHQREFLNELKENVSELSNKMTSLLSDYSEQANSQTERHLRSWAEHTTNYSQQMNNAILALSNVVDEIEGKLGQ